MSKLPLKTKESIEKHEYLTINDPDLSSISTDIRVVKMVRNSPIPLSLDVGEYMCKTWYVGQPVECDICQGGHVSKNCPLKGNGV